MARKLEAEGRAPTPPAQSAKGLSREDRAALKTKHVLSLLEAARTVELMREPLKNAQEEFTARINLAKAELGAGYSRQYLLGLLADYKQGARAGGRLELQRQEDREDLGLPTFTQLELKFGNDATPQETKDELAWESEGYLAGRRAEDPTAPDGCPARMVTHFMKGYHEGVAQNGKLLARAGEVAKERDEAAKPKAPAPEVKDPLDPAEVKKAAKALEAKGFTQKNGAKPPQPLHA